MVARDSWQSSHRAEQGAHHEPFRPTNHLTESAYGRPGDRSAFGHRRSSAEPMGDLHMPPLHYGSSDKGRRGNEGRAPNGGGFTAHQILHGAQSGGDAARNGRPAGAGGDGKVQHLDFPSLFHATASGQQRDSSSSQYQVQKGDNLWNI